MPTTNIFPSFTPDVHTNGDLANKANFDAVDVPQNNFISAIDDLRDLGVLTSSTVLVQNRDIMAAMNAASGNRFFTLPSATGQRFPITLKKVDTSSNTVTINRAGSNTIEDPANPLLSPTATSFVLRQPDECVTLYPFGTTQWRILKHYTPELYVYAKVYASSSTAVTNTTTVITFNSESWDYSSNYNTFTNKFTVPIDGIYELKAKIGFDNGGGSANSFYPMFYVNGTNRGRFYEVYGQSGSNTGFYGETHLSLVAGDEIDIRARAVLHTRNTSTGEDDTYAMFKLVKRL
jgi:hypothetical protein